MLSCCFLDVVVTYVQLVLTYSLRDRHVCLMQKEKDIAGTWWLILNWMMFNSMTPR